MTIFINDSVDTPNVFTAQNANIALDNIHIVILKSVEDHIALSILNGTIMLVDSRIMNGYDISFYDHSCQLLENNRLLNNTDYISLWLLICEENGDTKYLSNPVLKTVDHLSQYQLNILPESTSYYPGQILSFKLEILDKLGNKISTNSTPEISVVIESSSMTIAVLDINKENQCTICVDDSITISSVSIKDNVGSDLVLDMSATNTMLSLTSSEITLDIIGCPVMYGPSPSNYTCIPCDLDHYNIDLSNVEFCSSCDPTDEGFVVCKDGNINIQSNYWMEISESGDIVSSLCPSSQCCQNDIYCDYINGKNSLCAEGRNYSSILCSKCMDGYSVSMNNSKCIKCTESIYYTYLLYPFGISLLWVVYITLSTSDKYKRTPSGDRTKPKKGSSCLKAVQNRIESMLSKKYFMLMLKTIINRNIMYYEQAMAQLLSQGSDTLLFSRFTQMFNLSITNTVSNNDTGWCLIKGLTSKQKILTDLISPAFVFVIICTMYLMSICRKNGAVVYFSKRQINFKKTFISLILLLIGNILSVLFKLLHCQKIEDDTYHFYFAFEQCFGRTWIISMVIMI